MGLADVATIIPSASTINSTLSNGDDNGPVKVVTEEYTDDQGRLVRTTRRVRLRLVSEKVRPEAISRGAAWHKFGDAADDGPGPNLSSTIVGEPVYLKLSRQGVVEGGAGGEDGSAKGAVVQAKNIVCRYCQGSHWSAKCPYKSTFASEEGATSTAGEGGNATGTAAAAGRAQKYIPPSLRRSMEQAGDVGAMAGMGTTATRPENPNTVRLSNLSEIVTEADLRDLVNRIVPPSRVYVVKDPRTMLCRGSAYVSFHMPEDAERVVQKLNGHLYGNLVMHAEMAKPQQS